MAETRQTGPALAPADRPGGSPRRGTEAAAGSESPSRAEAVSGGAPPGPEPDRVRMRCPVCEAPAEWAGQKWRCRRCGWLSS